MRKVRQRGEEQSPGERKIYAHCYFENIVRWVSSKPVKWAWRNWVRVRPIGTWYCALTVGWKYPSLHHCLKFAEDVGTMFDAVK